MHRTVRCRWCGRESKPLRWSMDDDTARLCMEHACCLACRERLCGRRDAIPDTATAVFPPRLTVIE